MSYKCIKCGNTQYETDQFQATGGGFAKVFDVQNKKFTTITCSTCKYTELYKADVSDMENIFDLFIGG